VGWRRGKLLSSLRTKENRGKTGSPHKKKQNGPAEHEGIWAQEQCDFGQRTEEAKGCCVFLVRDTDGLRAPQELERQVPTRAGGVEKVKKSMAGGGEL